VRPIRASLTSRMHTAVPDSTFSGRSRHNRHAERQARVHSIHIQTTGGTLAAHAVMRVLCRSPCQVLALSGARLVRCSPCQVLALSGARDAALPSGLDVVSASGTGTRADRASGIAASGGRFLRFLELAYNVTTCVGQLRIYGFTRYHALLGPSRPPPSHTLPDPVPRVSQRRQRDRADTGSSVSLSA
jgi:hypothetical protein